jgi:uncharacterized damage-inducible protein DinB
MGGNSMSERYQDKLDAIRSHRRTVFNRLAATNDSHLTKRTRWGRGPADARYLFLRFSDHEEEHARQVQDNLAALGWRPTKVQRILEMAERTRGEILAALVGLGDDDLDVAPVEPAGEWTLRQILVHLVDTEHSYRINTLHAVSKYLAGEPHGEAPPREDPSRFQHLSFDELMTEFDAARNQSIAELAGLSDDVLIAPATWYGGDVNVNWRLMRFSHHEREHAAHLQKWRMQTGRHQTDAQRLLGLGWKSHGLMRGALVGVPQKLVDVSPGGDEWSIDRILDHYYEADGFFTRMIDAAQ